LCWYIAYSSRVEFLEEGVRIETKLTTVVIVVPAATAPAAAAVAAEEATADDRAAPPFAAFVPALTAMLCITCVLRVVQKE
jgi:hypothetical protein